MSLKEIFHKRTVLVTEHTGFKGSWLSAWLHHLGANVTGVALDPPSTPSHFVVASIDQWLHDVRIDICDQNSLRNIVVDIQPDYLFHLAAQPLVGRSYVDPVETCQTNVIGTLHVLEALRQLTTPCVAVIVTSDKCYDNVEWVWGYRETDRLGGSDPYSSSKAAAEFMIRSHVKSFFPYEGKIRIGIGRAGNVIGGGDWATDRIVPDCVRTWASGKTAILRNPAATRPWQHILEPLSGYLTLALALARDPKIHGEPFNFGPNANQDHSVGDLVSAMSDHWPNAGWMQAPANIEQPLESGLLKLNCDKADRYLGWHATLSFQETVQMTAEWYRDYYENTGSPKDKTLSQIREYESVAQQRGPPWAQPA